MNIIISLILQDDGNINVYENEKRVFHRSYWMGDSLEKNQREAIEFVEKTYGKNYTLIPFYADNRGIGYLFDFN